LQRIAGGTVREGSRANGKNVRCGHLVVVKHAPVLPNIDFVFCETGHQALDVIVQIRNCMLVALARSKVAIYGRGEAPKDVDAGGNEGQPVPRVRVTVSLVYFLKKFNMGIF
jgi:hypothetical protein